MHVSTNNRKKKTAALKERERTKREGEIKTELKNGPSGRERNKGRDERKR